MLLPPLRERMELLHSLLPQGPDRWESLSKGQVGSRKNSLCFGSNGGALKSEVSLICKVHEMLCMHVVDGMFCEAQLKRCSLAKSKSSKVRSTTTCFLMRS